MRSVFCFSQVIMSLYRIMWIYWCLWIVLIIQSCDGDGDQYFASTKVGSDTFTASEGDNVTMTCEYTVNYTTSNIQNGTVWFTWLKKCYE